MKRFSNPKGGVTTRALVEKKTARVFCSHHPQKKNAKKVKTLKAREKYASI